MTTIFTYGTLMRGHRNNVLLRGQKFVGEAKTEAKYKLYHNDSFPCMVESEDGDIIEGEMWEVDARCLARLDILEGIPHLYRRADIKIQGHDNVQGYIYQRPVDGLTPCGNSWPQK